MSLRDLAERIRWNYTLTGKWEQGKNRLPAEAIMTLDTQLDAEGGLISQALRAAMVDTSRLRMGSMRSAPPGADKDDEAEFRALTSA